MCKCIEYINIIDKDNYHIKYSINMYSLQGIKLLPKCNTNECQCKYCSKCITHLSEGFRA